MTHDHPITPSPDLIRQIRGNAVGNISCSDMVREASIIVSAYQAGADAELDACCKWLDIPVDYEASMSAPESVHLRAARRPNLKNQALEALERKKSLEGGYPCNSQDDVDWDVIRRALESLPDTLTSGGNDDNRDN